MHAAPLVQIFCGIAHTFTFTNLILARQHCLARPRLVYLKSADPANLTFLQQHHDNPHPASDQRGAWISGISFSLPPSTHLILRTSSGWWLLSPWRSSWLPLSLAKHSTLGPPYLLSTNQRTIINMSSNSPPKTVSLDSEDTSRQETGKQFHLTFKFDIFADVFLFLAVSSAKTETALQHVTTPVQQRRLLPSTRSDNNSKRSFVSLPLNVISL